MNKKTFKLEMNWPENVSELHGGRLTEHKPSFLNLTGYIRHNEHLIGCKIAIPTANLDQEITFIDYLNAPVYPPLPQPSVDGLTINRIIETGSITVSVNIPEELCRMLPKEHVGVAHRVANNELKYLEQKERKLAAGVPDVLPASLPINTVYLANGKFAHIDMVGSDFKAKMIYVTNYVDCECDQDYIHELTSDADVSDIICDKCHTEVGDAPNSRLNELLAMKIGD